MKRKELIQMWVPEDFKRYIYKQKSKNPKKTIKEILEDISQNDGEIKDEQRFKLFK